MDDKLREEILAKTQEILNDEMLLRALIEASDKNLGSKIVDLRSVAMQKMDGELKKLKRSNQQVIATAYENLVGMKQVHQVVLKSLEQNNFDEFITNLDTEACDILRVDCIKLGLETHYSLQNTEKNDSKLFELLDLYPVDFVDTYISQGENNGTDDVVLRPTPKGSEQVYGKLSKNLKSEGCIKLKIGNKKIIGILALASKEREKFTAQQGVELLKFMGSVFERRISHWLN
tara:strand:- start:1486 stop:2181 length:696 start_codon:yes stop_codon:yes gene_type:complete